MYLQIPVEEECSKLLCIYTHHGLYKFGHHPFGIKVVPAIFQQVMDTMLSDLDFAVAYLDNILMGSQNVEQIKSMFIKSSQEFGSTVSN